jgi:SAM-dependent methyltransferase
LSDKELIEDAVAWDIANWKKAINFWQKELGEDFFKGKKALEIGGGNNGGLSLWLAHKGCQVTFSSNEVISESAKKIHRKWNLENSINYKSLDALMWDEKDQSDIICFKSVLGGIARDGEGTDRIVLENCYKALTPNGVILFAENLKGSALHLIFRRWFSEAWKNKWVYFDINYLESIAKDKFTVNAVALGYLACFGFFEKIKTFFSLLDYYFFDRILSRNILYTAAFILKKQEDRSTSQSTTIRSHDILPTNHK